MEPWFAKWVADVATMSAAKVSKKVNEYKRSVYNPHNTRTQSGWEVLRWEGVVVLRKRQIELAELALAGWQLAARNEQRARENAKGAK